MPLCLAISALGLATSSGWFTTPAFKPLANSLAKRDVAFAADEAAAKEALVELGLVRELRLRKPHEVRIMDLDRDDSVDFHELGLARFCRLRNPPTRLIKLPVEAVPAPPAVVTAAFPSLGDAHSVGAPAQVTINHDEMFDGIRASRARAPLRRKQIFGRRAVR